MKNYFLSLISLVLTLVIAEVFLQFFLKEPTQKSVSTKPYFHYHDSIGYEPLPFVKPINGENILETLNIEGARGKSYQINKPQNLLRIISIGNSVVEGFSVGFNHTWQQVLERQLNQVLLQKKSIYKKAEVINLGVGGYVSWQTLKRFKNRGLKYSPDWVIVYTDVNDMVYSALPSWKPNYNLAQIEQAYAKPSVDTTQRVTIKSILLKSKIMASINNVKNHFYNKNLVNSTIAAHQQNSNIPFNKEALRLYEEHLSQIYELTKEKKLKMILITWGFAISEKHQERELQLKMLNLYQNFPLSSQEFLDWYKQYNEVNRRFAEKYPDIVLIDIAKELENVGLEERLKIYTDQIHQSVYGHSFFASLIYKELVKQGLL
jgi:lysophospholipase L1-like esterase